MNLDKLLEQLVLSDKHWQAALAGEKEQPYFQQLMQFLQQERLQGQTVFPPKERIFAALQTTPIDDVKVVILGQDPYHGAGQANGLCFSVHRDIAIPPSLQNIYKELQSDLGLAHPGHGDLSAWAEQGVLLLNTVLTVRAGQPQSHQNRGWETFTNRVISAVNERCEHVVFMLWGKPAQSKMTMIDSRRHTVLTAPHPSPLSAHRGFLGCRHFSKASAALQKHNQAPINWDLR